MNLLKIYMKTIDIHMNVCYTRIAKQERQV